jgi:hypothetical protein
MCAGARGHSDSLLFVASVTVMISIYKGGEYKRGDKFLGTFFCISVSCVRTQQVAYVSHGVVYSE